MNKKDFSFLDTVSLTMEGIIDLHHYIFFYLILILIFVSCFYYYVYIFSNNSKKEFTVTQDQKLSEDNTFIIDSDYIEYYQPSFKFNINLALDLFFFDLLENPFILLSSYIFSLLLLILTIDLLHISILFIFLPFLIVFSFSIIRGFLLLNPLFAPHIGAFIFFIIRIIFFTEIEFAPTILSVFTIVPTAGKIPTVPLSGTSHNFFETPFTRGPVYTQTTLLYFHKPEVFPSFSSKLFREIYLEDRPQSIYSDLYVLKNFNKTQQGATCSNLTSSIEKLNTILTNKIPEDAHIEDPFHKLNTLVKNKDDSKIITLLKHDLPYYENLSLFQKNKEITLGLSTLLEHHGRCKKEILESFVPSYNKFDLKAKIEGKEWKIDVLSPGKYINLDTLDNKTKSKNYNDSMIIINNGDNLNFIHLESTKRFKEISEEFKGKILIASPHNLQYLADLLEENIDTSSLKDHDNEKNFYIPPQTLKSYTCDFDYFRDFIFKYNKSKK